MPPSSSLFGTVEGRRAGRLLEFDRVLDAVAGNAILGRAADRVRETEPVSDAEFLRRQWLWYEELRRLETGEGEISLGSMVDLPGLIGDEREERGLLGTQDVAAVAGAATALSAMLRSVRAKADRLALTAKHLRDTFDAGTLASHLLDAVEPSGQIRDTASPALRGLRRAVSVVRSQLREVARNEMNRARGGGHTSGDELVLRGDRICIPVRSGSRASVAGIIHDRSSTGATLFIEPSRVVEAGNALSEAEIAVREEEHRILIELNRMISADAAGLLDAFERAVVLDAMRARVRWGIRESAKAPSVPGDRRHFSLEGFRHPLLAESLAAVGRAEDLVPLTFVVDDSRVVLVSGPNAGGKTVMLKSAGLAVLMAQAVLPLPTAHPARLPVFDAVLIDLGDEQSIADALSSFSAHITHLEAILAEVDAHSLVLLDEIGGGTDPQEGVVLARAVLEHLARSGARTLVTTHYGQLKVLVEEDDGFRHASMAFDHERLRPRFEIELDLPGASHALSIARRLELPEPVLKRAEELLGDDRLLLDELLRSLQVERAEAVRLREELQGERDQTRLSRQRYDTMARELKGQRKDRLGRAEREAEGIVRNARKRVESLLREIREAGGSGKAVEAAREARDVIAAQADQLAERIRAREPAAEPVQPAEIVEGGLVRHAGLGKVGRIVAIRGDRITLEIGEARVVATADQLLRPDDAEAAEATRPRVGSIRTELVEASPIAASQVDVRGMDAEEAWTCVDRAVDRGLVTGMAELRVIHGKGTGRLRSVLAQRLDADPRVSSAEIGGGGHFDDGVTVVRL